jgi:hypothetical protein
VLAEVALRVRERHLEPLSGELLIVALADEDMPAEFKEEMGQELWSMRDQWTPGDMAGAEMEGQDKRDYVMTDEFWEVMHVLMQSALRMQSALLSPES